MVKGGSGRVGALAAAAGLLAAAALAALAALAVPAPAAPASAAGRALTAAQVGDTSGDEARLLREVEESLSRKKALDAKVAELDGKLQTTQSELRGAQSRLRALEQREKGTEGKLAAIRVQMEAAQQALKDLAIAAYTGQADAGRLAGLFLGASDITEMATRQAYRRIISSTQAEIVVSRERLRDQTDDLLAELDHARSRAQSERDMVATQQTRLRSERDAQAAVRHQAAVEVANYDSALGEIVSRRDEFEAQARELQAQSEAVAESLGRRRQADASSATASASESASSGSGGGGRLGLPLQTISVASAFGYRIHPVYGDRRLHTGIDLNGSTGTPIRAAAAGTVVTAGWLGGYGNAVVIDHGGGLATLYAHQSAILVIQGAEVDRGQVIGRVGCTGTCTGPHLHYEVRINGSPVDPSAYL